MEEEEVRATLLQATDTVVRMARLAILEVVPEVLELERTLVEDMVEAPDSKEDKVVVVEEQADMELPRPHLELAES